MAVTPKSVLLNTVLVIVSVTVCCVGAEIVARFVAPHGEGYPVVGHLVEQSKLVKERFVPSQPYPMERGTVAAINRQGFRGEDFVVEKEPGAYRIACMGDSFTFGLNVADDATWPHQLGAVLARDEGARRFEVYNFGLPGCATEHEFAALKERVLPFKPDLVILEWFEGDWEPVLVVEERVIVPSMGSQFLVTDDGYIPVAFPLPDALNRPLLLHSVFYRWIAERYYKAKVRFGREELMERNGKLLQEMQRFCRERGVDFLLLFFPNTGSVLAHLEAFPDYRVVHKAVEEAGIPTVDFYRLFRDVDLASIAIWDGHYNREGYRMVADAVAGWVAGNVKDGSILQ